MSKIEKMIKELCPEGVERVRLGDCCSILNGYAFQSSKYVPNGIRIIRISDVQDGYISNNDKKFYPIAEENNIKQYFLYENDLVISLTGNVGRVAFIPKVAVPAALNQRVGCIKAKRNAFTKYLFYLLFNQKFQKIAMDNANGAGQKNLSTKWLMNYFIPLPPLAIQQEIVSVLDSFTTLIDKMKKEVKMRKKQMEYYRDKLICKQDVSKKSIIKIGTIERGSGLQKKDFTDTGIGCIHYGQIYTRLSSSCNKTLTFVPQSLADKLTKVHPGDLVIACTSENVEDVCKSIVWLGNEDIVTGGHACVLRHKENPKYISYCFQTTDFALQKSQYAYGAKVIDIKTDKLGMIKIPVPPLSRQQEIVSILDTFEAYISKMEKLIALRQKQYEYYREKLLTFE